jgi:hypothetical protein
LITYSQDILWEKSYGGTHADYLFDAQPTADYGFILAGSSLSNKTGNKTDDNQGDLDYWIWKMDEKGDLDWQKSFGGSGFDLLQSIKNTRDGGFILAGTSSSRTGFQKKEDCKGITDYWVIIFNSMELQLLMERENRYKHLDIRNNVLISLLIYQGLASDEIVRLTVKDIDLDNGTIYIKGSANLNKRKLELVPKQMILFSNYINETRPALKRCTTDKLILTKLGKPITVDSIHAMTEPLRGLFPDRKLNPQTIRMSVICNWLNEKNIPLERVQELAGHKWPGTTEKYIKVNALEQRELINRYFPSI